MEQHQKEQEINFKPLFYLVGLVSGLTVGVIIDNGLVWTGGLGVTGLLFAAFFVSVFVRGREQR